MKKIFGLGLVLVGVVMLSAFGTDGGNTLVRFNGGIGVDPISNVTVNGSTVIANANVVRGVKPPGQIWRIGDLDAKVSTDGRIRVGGRGLLLAGGDGIGTTAGLSVFATLFCGAPGSATASSSNPAGVPLDPDGDFTIDDVLSPLPPNPCDTPVLLIRLTLGTQPWFAAGIEK